MGKNKSTPEGEFSSQEAADRRRGTYELHPIVGDVLGYGADHLLYQVDNIVGLDKAGRYALRGSINYGHFLAAVTLNLVEGQNLGQAADSALFDAFFSMGTECVLKRVGLGPLALPLAITETVGNLAREPQKAVLELATKHDPLSDPEFFSRYSPAQQLAILSDDFSGDLRFAASLVAVPIFVADKMEWARSGIYKWLKEGGLADAISRVPLIVPNMFADLSASEIPAISPPLEQAQRPEKKLEAPSPFVADPIFRKEGLASGFCVNPSLDDRANLSLLGINFCYQSPITGQVVYSIGKGSPYFDAEMHQVLSELESLGAARAVPSSAAEKKSSAETVEKKSATNERPHYRPSQPPKLDKPKAPLLGDFRIIATASGLGIGATAAGSGVITITAGESGLLLSISANFGPGFWAGLGASAGVGAVIAGVMLASAHFYKRHVNHNLHKLNKSLRNTQGDGQAIADHVVRLNTKLENLQISEIPQIQGDIKGITGFINGKINKEMERAQFARKEHKNAAENAHLETVLAYRETLSALGDLAPL